MDVDARIKSGHDNEIKIGDRNPTVHLRET